MKILVVYDTSSMAWGAGAAPRNTEKVARAISEVLKEEGFDVECLYVKDVDPAIVKNYDCILAGSPTQWHKATGPIMQFLDRFAKSEFTGKLAAAFDTQLQMPLSGNAGKGIEKRLEKLGFKIVAPPLATYVQSNKNAEGKNEMQLKEGELEKAKNWAEEVAKVLPK
jgi:flavodoxin